MGGRKKKKAKVQEKKESKFKIPKIFNCPLCDGKACLIIKMQKTVGIATVRCRICNKPNPAFTCTFCRLHKPVDVYYMFYEYCRHQDVEARRSLALKHPEGIPPLLNLPGTSGGMPYDAPSRDVAAVAHTESMPSEDDPNQNAQDDMAVADEDIDEFFANE